jgi:ElaA protein
VGSAGIAGVVYDDGMIEWKWYRLGELSALQLYAILAAREAVFVVEQQCPYQELDGLDSSARHLVGWLGGNVAAYVRVLPPGLRFAEASLGRLMTDASLRRQGLGRQALDRALALVQASYPEAALRISAQNYLEGFYRAYGFERCSEAFLEDGIPHVEMLRPAAGLTFNPALPGNTG